MLVGISGSKYAAWSPRLGLCTGACRLILRCCSPIMILMVFAILTSDVRFWLLIVCVIVWAL